MSFAQTGTFLIALAFVLSSGLAVSANDAAQKSGNALNGYVQKDGAVFRIKRTAPVSAKPVQKPVQDKSLLYGSVEHNKNLPPRPQTRTQEPALDSFVTADDYASPPAPAPQNNTPLQAAASKQASATFIWGQSADGGYFDASGQHKSNVMGDELYKYGGKFLDGSPVPTTPVVCNFKGHVYKPFVVKRVR